MVEILIRSGKDPFTPVGAEATLTQDVFNTNVGNYLFAHSVHKALMVPGTELVSNATLSETRKATDATAAAVNERFDAFVIPLANAFRPEFLHRLVNLTSLVERLDIPVVVIGVGAQTGMDLDLADLEPVREATRGFVSAVLDRSASIGVRGAFTRDFLTGLGFPDSSVEVIGCPSLFLHGPDFRLTRPDRIFDSASRIALNVTHGVPGLPALVESLIDQHPRLVYVGQDKHDLRLMLWGEEPDDERDQRLPFHLGHRLYAEDRVRFPLDMWTWMDLLRDMDLAVGTRFHGNVSATLADTPAMLLVHDSRTLELADTHVLPHLLMADVAPGTTAQQLYDAYDPTGFNAAYPDRFATYLSFLERNGLGHVYAPGGQDDRYDARVAAADFPDPVTPLHSPATDQVAARLRWLRDGQAFDSSVQLGSYRQPFPVPPPRERSDRHTHAHERAEVRTTRLEKQLATANRALARSQERIKTQRERLARQAARLDNQAARLAGLEARLASVEESLLRKVARRLRHVGRPPE